MDSDLRELIRLVEEIAIIERENYYTIPWEKVNQRDVLRKRIEKRLTVSDETKHKIEKILSEYMSPKNVHITMRNIYGEEQ